MLTPVCIFAFRVGERCGGAVQHHHLIPQQTLKSRFKTLVANGTDPPSTLPKILKDERNLAPLCWDHHQRIENKRLQIPKAFLPEELEEFANSLGLVWYVERYYPEALCST